MYEIERTAQTVSGLYDDRAKSERCGQPCRLKNAEGRSPAFGFWIGFIIVVARLLARSGEVLPIDTIQLEPLGDIVDKLIQTRRRVNRLQCA